MEKKNQGTQRWFRSYRINSSWPLDYQIFLGLLEGFSYIPVRQHTKEEILVGRESPLTTRSPKEGGISPFMLNSCHTKSFCHSWAVLRTGDQDGLWWGLILQQHPETLLLPGPKLCHTHSCASSMSSHPRRARDFVLLFFETFNYNQ